MQRWEGIEEYLIGQAGDDLLATGGVRPCLAAWRGDEPLAIAWLRPFPGRAYQKPMVELLAMTVPLGADRYALSVSGRVWSLDDPIPPVTEGADLRQKALVITRVDGRAGPPARIASAIHPYDLEGETLRWHERLDPGPIEGWLSGALQLAVSARDELRMPDREIRQQARRCVRLGHVVALAPPVAHRLGLESSSTRPAGRAESGPGSPRQP